MHFIPPAGNGNGPCRAHVVDGTGALLWSLWRANQWAVEWASLAGMGDVMDCGVLLMDLAWRKSTRNAYYAWSAIEVVTGVSCFGGVPDSSNIPRYRKIASLIAHVFCYAIPGAVLALLEAIETFAALSIGKWLKVAGAQKAEVLSSALTTSATNHSNRYGSYLELGTFIGYSAARLSAHGAPVMTLEQDPIHIAMARWHLDHAHALTKVEVWPGRAVDSMPNIAEVLGAMSICFLFLDESGASFAADHAQLERLNSLFPITQLVADNCVRPGAPIFTARCLRIGATCASTAWALPEFLEERFGIEDWMVVMCCGLSSQASKGARS